MGLIGAESGADLNIRNFPEIIYEYRVGGKRYTGKRVTIGATSVMRMYFHPDVAIRYKVNGIEYRGNRLSFGGRVYVSYDLFARNRIRQYRPEDRVELDYNLDNAAQSVLERRAYGEWVVWALMAVFAGGAVWLSVIYA